jgi:hypothetical protein
MAATTAAAAGATSATAHLEIVEFAEDYTSPKFKTTGYENKTVVVTGHLTLPKDTVFKVANLVNLGIISFSGASAAIEATNIYSMGTIESEKRLRIKATKVDFIGGKGPDIHFEVSGAVSVLQDPPEKELIALGVMNFVNDFLKACPSYSPS